MQKVPREGAGKVAATVAGRPFEFATQDVERCARSLEPDPIRDHFVVVGGRRFPPKQVVAALTGLDRADFTTYQARSLLRRLGFTVSRISAPSTTLAREQAPTYGEDPAGAAEAEELRPYRGRWVALKDGKVLFDAGSPEDVLRWLERNAKTADSMFAVPIDPAVDIGGFAL